MMKTASSHRAIPRRTQISRRTLLRGLGGVAVALPFLDVMDSRPARAQAAREMRYVVAFGGVSPMPSYPPRTLGRDYELTLGLRPLGGRSVAPVQARPPYDWDDVKDAFTVVSNLRVPERAAGGYFGGWHSAVVGPLLSGVASTADDNPHPRGITSDMVVAGALPQDLRFRWLGYRVQPTGYRGNDNRSGIGTISRSATTLMQPIQSPRVAYDQFFTNFPSSDPQMPVDPASQLALAKQRSVLDLISFSAERLKARLGRADLSRLDEHFTQIRELERRISAIPEVTPPEMSACDRLSDPGPDPGTSTNFANDYANRTVGYSGEVERAKVMVDLIHMAFACDHARVASLMITYPMCFMTVEPIIGNRRVDLHDLGHGGGSANDMARATSWHVEQLARLASLLRNTREGDGNLLDNTVMVFSTEGGCTDETHSSDNTVVLVGGGRAAGLVQGTHIDGRRRHPAQVLVSAMNAVGVDTNSLGAVSGRIDELHM